MFRLHPKPNSQPIGSGRRGLTFIELMITVMITSMLSVVIGGLVMAVQTAREHSEGVGEASMQAQIANERIHYMVEQTGTYKMEGQPTTLGMAVVSHERNSYPLFDILVVWSGGRNGGMAANGLQQRLPLVNELLFYTPDPLNPSHLVEIAIPGNESSIDFRNTYFTNYVRTLIESQGTEQVLLCDRLRTSLLEASGYESEATLGNARFELVFFPSDEQLALVTPGTEDWLLLRWAQGLVTSGTGFRQANLRTEFQIEPRYAESAGTELVSIALPYFGSMSTRYEYEP